MALDGRQDGDHAIGEKLVKDLAGMRFVVPSYQRGYRWERTQVQELLDDLYGFNPTDPNDSAARAKTMIRLDNDRSIVIFIEAV